MNVHIQSTRLKWSADCTTIFVYSDESLKDSAPDIVENFPWIATSPVLRDFTGKKDQHVFIHGDESISLSRFLLVGLGTKEKFTTQSFRLAVANALKTCEPFSYSSVAFSLDNLEKVASSIGISGNVAAKEAVVAAFLSAYRCEKYKTVQPENENNPIVSLAFLTSQEGVSDELQIAVSEGEAESSGVLFARTLINSPANYITPTVLAEEAKKLAKRYGYSCTVLDEADISKMGMGAFASVSRGSEQEARFIVLEYSREDNKGENPFIVVGKGVTFDSGGISLKPAAKMHEMKGDMAGAAAVLGFFEAIGNLPDKNTLPRIIGLIPSAENMPSGTATRPGDIVTTLSGKTVEIINTDAEGRLLLCDALTYAQKHWSPKALVNIATLTGACVVAIGDDASGLFTDHEWLRQDIMDASESLGELFWPMPMWDAYDKNIDSTVADMQNTGPREGGAVHAALFLRRFVEKSIPWAHLDIAGPGYVVKTSPLHPVSGGTGEGVRLFCALARKFSHK